MSVKKVPMPITKGRFKGVSISRDKNGVFVHTHRVRGKSRKNKAAISDSEIKRIRATG